MHPSLPAPYTARPATLEDAKAAADLFNACSMEDLSGDQFQAGTTAAEWQFPGFELARDTQVVLSETCSLVAYSEVWDSQPHVWAVGWGCVHPAHRGQGLGTYLLGWADQRATAAIALAPPDARVVITQSTQDSNSGAKELLAANGYAPIRYFNRMLADLDTPPPAPVWPEGITVHPFNRDADLEAVLRADQESFADHWGNIAHPLEEDMALWAHWIDNDPKFDPTLWFLAMDGDEKAGICLCRAVCQEDPDMGWVNTLGVRRAWRRRGLGLALLRHAFGELYRRGRKRVGLGVDADNLTGAMRLYEKVGMRVQYRRCTFEKELRPGRELRTESLDA